MLISTSQPPSPNAFEFATRARRKETGYIGGRDLGKTGCSERTLNFLEVSLELKILSLQYSPWSLRSNEVI